MPRVYVTQFFTRGDFSKAEDFGEVVFMTNLEHKPEPTHTGSNDEVLQDLARAMQQYEPGRDFLLVAPSQVINVLIGSLLEEGEHKILKWDNRIRTYRIHKVYV